MKTMKIRQSIAVLSVIGLLDALYMLSYQQGRVKSMYCPFFGRGCDIVGRSSQAKHLGIYNAAIGALAFITMASLAMWNDKSNNSRQTFGLSAISLAAFGASAMLTAEQMVKIKAWCFWCLLSTVLNATIVSLALFLREKEDQSDE